MRGNVHHCCVTLVPVCRSATDKGRKVHFAALMDLCHLKNFGVGASVSKVQMQSRTPS